MSGLSRVGIAPTMKDAYGRIITQKYLLGVDVEALGAVPWANWFAWFLIGISGLMLAGATRKKEMKST